MPKRVNMGWLAINRMTKQHYWVKRSGSGFFHALCGRLAIPETIDTHSPLLQCEFCQRMRLFEQADEDAQADGVK